MIWLIDYSHYQISIDSELNSCKKDYFKIKSFVRHKIIGETAPVKTRVFSTGLLRIATLLKANGVDARYLHYYMLEDLLNNGAEMPECIAFSALCPTVPRCAVLCQKIKKVSPKTKVLLAGIHVNVAEEETIRRYGEVFDGFVVGFETEGAESLIGRKLRILPEKYVDYSLLPFPLSEYAINTFTTMGCPFACEYCVDGRSPHFCASPNGQIDDMLKLLPKRNLIHFFDSVFGYSQEGILRACEQIKATNHNFVLSCDMRAEILTPEILRALSQAGFAEIRMGMESSDDSLLKQNGRTLAFHRLNEQLAMIRECSNIYVTLYTITGLPGTTWQNHEQTLDACDELFRRGMVDEIKNTLYVPYPMTDVNYSERGVIILDQDWSHYDRQSMPVYRTEQMSREDLWQLYIHTARRINDSWLRGLGFSDISEIPEQQNYYSEYIEYNYNIR